MLWMESPQGELRVSNSAMQCAFLHKMDIMKNIRSWGSCMGEVGIQIRCHSEENTSFNILTQNQYGEKLVKLEKRNIFKFQTSMHFFENFLRIQKCT